MTIKLDANGNIITSAEAAPAAPVEDTPTATVSVTDNSEDGSVLGTVVSEAYRAVVGGARDGVQEIGETIQWAGSSIGNAITGGHDIYYTQDDGWEWLTLEEASDRTDIPQWSRIGETPLLGDGGYLSLPDVAENETVVGSMGRGVSQFLAGYGAVSRSLQLAKAGTKATAVAQAFGKGAVADFSSFDAHEDRMSDFLRDNAGLRDPITEFLQADEDDSVLEGKLKNAIEGAGLGAVTDGVVYLAKSFKRAKKLEIEGKPEEAAQVMNEAAEKLDPETGELQLDLFDADTDPNINTGSADVKAVGGKNGNPDSSSLPDGGSPDLPDGVIPEGAGSVTVANSVAKGTQTTPTKPVNTDALQANLDREIGLRRGGSIPDPDRVPEGELFNFGRMDSGVDVLDVLNDATESIVKHGTKDKTTFAEIEADALKWTTDFVDVDPEIVRSSLARQAADAERQQGLVIASKQIALSLSREVETLAEKVSMGQASDADKALFLKRQQQLIDIGANLKSVIRGAAQTTSAGRIHSYDAVTGQQLAASDIAKELSEIVANSGDKVEDLAKAVMANKKAGGSKATLLRIAESGNKSLARKANEIVNEVYINSILSGPKTHMINIVSNALNTVMLPAEKIVGASFRGDVGVMREGARQFYGLSMALKDAIKATGSALRHGRNILDPEAAVLEANGVDYRAIRSDSENPVVNTLINGLGGFIRLPGRALMGGDEFFKQLNYRSNLYARLMSEASDLISQGKLTQAQAEKFVSDRMMTAFDRHGGARAKMELEYAREATFTQALRRDSPLGSFGLGIQNATNKYPPLKLILPFVRTPANILKAGLQRTPVLRRLSKSIQEDLASGDPRRVAQANGKLATGVTLYSSAAMLAMEGQITGSGPSDPAQKALLYETGWRPYSYKRTRADGSIEYVEYRRLEPFAMIFGTVADIVDISGQVSDMDGQELASAVSIAFANNVASKTFLQGIVDAVEAFSDPDRYMDRFILNYASAMVPHSAFWREIRKGKDPVMRDVRNLTSAVKNTVPGYSESIPARRSWITGQPVTYPKGWGANAVDPVGTAMAAANPVIAGDLKDDVVLNELASLEFGFSSPTRKINGIELDEAQYSRLLELHGTTRLGRYTMKERLEALFTSDRYKRYGDEYSDPSVDPRIKMVRQVISKYREAARRELQKEYPELKEAVRSRKREAAANARAIYSGITSLAE